eukprot:scaffold7364_cov31-Tisochrysis_lutea.AAC.1
MASAVPMPGVSPSHKLTNVEAQRIMAILAEMLSKLNLIARLPSGHLPDTSSLRAALSSDVLQLLEEQMILEQQYEWVSRAQAAGGAPAGTDMPDFETLDDELRHSTRVVCRMLKEAPGIITQVNSSVEEPDGKATPSMRRFLKSLNDLKDQTYARLCMSVEEEKAKNDWFEEVRTREERASHQLRQLQKELRSEKADREKDVSTRDEQIRKLRVELEGIQKSTLAQIAEIEAEAKAQEDADRQAFIDRESALRAELNKVKADLTAKRKENKDSEDALRKRKVKNESEVEQWIAKYDQDVGEKDAELNSLKAVYADEQKEIARLESYFAEMAAERELQLEKERKLAALRAREHAQQQALEKAATYVQKIWRGKRERRALEKAKSGKGGKGGKGGKKKK